MAFTLETKAQREARSAQTWFAVAVMLCALALGMLAVHALVWRDQDEFDDWAEPAPHFERRATPYSTTWFWLSAAALAGHALHLAGALLLLGLSGTSDISGVLYLISAFATLGYNSFYTVYVLLKWVVPGQCEPNHFCNSGVPSGLLGVVVYAQYKVWFVMLVIAWVLAIVALILALRLRSARRVAALDAFSGTLGNCGIGANGADALRANLSARLHLMSSQRGAASSQKRFIGVPDEESGV